MISWTRLSLAALPLVSLTVACDPAESDVTFSKDVAPLMEQHCAACHQEGGIAPFSLTSYDEVASRVDLIAASTKARLMPPSTIDASGACQDFQDARWMSDEEIEVLQRWAKAGAPEGDKVTVKAPPLDTLEDADLVVEMPGPYTPKGSEEHPNDDYRCFIIPSITEVDRYMQGFEIFPGQASQVHHMLLFTLPNDSGVDEVNALEAQDEELGFECFATTFVDDITSFLGGWAPGNNTMRYPEGTGLHMPGGRPLVMQIHYNLLAGARPDLTRVKLKTVASVEAEAAIVPIADDGMVVPAGLADARFQVSYPLAGIADDILAYGVFPHMHLLGRTLKLSVTPLGAEQDEERCLVDVWRWDFHWQQMFLYQQPLAIYASDVVNLECGYDTRSRDTPVSWGEGTQDEMCLAFVYVTRINGGPLSGLLPD